MTDHESSRGSTQTAEPPSADASCAVGDLVVGEREITRDLLLSSCASARAELDRVDRKAAMLLAGMAVGGALLVRDFADVLIAYTSFSWWAAPLNIVSSTLLPSGLLLILVAAFLLLLVVRPSWLTVGRRTWTPWTDGRTHKLQPGQRDLPCRCCGAATDCPSCSTYPRFDYFGNVPDLYPEADGRGHGRAWRSAKVLRAVPVKDACHETVQQVIEAMADPTSSKLAAEFVALSYITYRKFWMLSRATEGLIIGSLCIGIGALAHAHWV